MRISQLNSNVSLFESYGLTDTYYKTWQRDIHPMLCEVAMDPASIESLFKSVEKNAGRSALGKGMDAVKAGADKISDVWFNKFGGMLQSSDVVQGFDAKWEQIKSSIAKEHPDLASKLAKYKEFADNNPKTQKFLLAIAGSVAAAAGVALAGGVGAGALAVGTGTGIAVGIVNIADRLLKNEKLSTAVGRGATTGLVAGLTAGALAKAKNVMDGMGATQIINNTQIHTVNVNGQQFYLKPEDYAEYIKGSRAASAILSKADIKDLGAAMDASSAADAANWAKTLAKIGSEAYQNDAISQISKVTVIEPGAVGQAANAVASAMKYISPVLSAVTGQAAGGAGQKQESKNYKGNRLTEAQLNELFGITGNKVDASSLMKAWKKAGSPTDSDAVAKILATGGVDQSVIQNAFKEVGVEAPIATTDAGDGRVEPTMDSPAQNNTQGQNMAEPTQDTAQQSADQNTQQGGEQAAGDQQMSGNVDVSGLQKLLPSVGKNPTPFKAAVAAIQANKPLTPVMKSALGNAFLDMVYMDAGPLGQVSTLLKKVSAKGA